MNDNIQTDIKQGNISFDSADFTGKEGLIAKLGSSGLSLPTSATDEAFYLIIDGSETSSSVAALAQANQVRIFLKGTCSMGDKLVVDSANSGYVKALPSTAGTYQIVAIAEEAGEDGQAVKCRGFLKVTTISS